MTSHEFETLKRWIASRTSIAITCANREFDKPFIEARLRDLAAADDAARAVLVSDNNQPTELDTADDAEIEEVTS